MSDSTATGNAQANGSIKMPLSDIKNSNDQSLLSKERLLYIDKVVDTTLPETNIAPENGWLEY